MTLEEIEERIAQIERYPKDSVRAHVIEDQLMLDFIRYVDGTKEKAATIKEKARAVLKVRKLQFPRYSQ